MYSKSAIIALALLAAWTPLCAQQTYSWVQRTGGDPVGTYADGATADFAWSWSPGGLPVTGHFTRRRLGPDLRREPIGGGYDPRPPARRPGI